MAIVGWKRCRERRERVLYGTESTQWLDVKAKQSAGRQLNSDVNEMDCCSAAMHTRIRFKLGSGRV